MIGPMSRERLLGAALLLLVFAAGFAVGIAVDRLARPQSGIRMVFGADMSGVLDKLDLTRKQRARAEAIVERRAPATQEMMLELGDRLRMISDSLDAELRTILTPEQRARLDALRSERRLMLKRTVTGPGGTSVTDTLFPRRDTTSRP